MNSENIRKVESSLHDLQQLSKCDDLDPETRDRVRKAQRELQASYLAEVSPSGYAAWKASRK